MYSRENNWSILPKFGSSIPIQLCKSPDGRKISVAKLVNFYLNISLDCLYPNQTAVFIQKVSQFFSLGGLFFLIEIVYEDI